MALSSKKKWFPYCKGGPARKWYGNLELVINWMDDGKEIKNNRDNGKLLSRPQNLEFQFLEAATWSLTSNSSIAFSARWRPMGCLFDINGMSLFGKQEYSSKKLTALLNSPFAAYSLELINPTMAFQSGDIARIPLPKDLGFDSTAAEKCIVLSKIDWDAYETSMDFSSSELIKYNKLLEGKSLREIYYNANLEYKGIVDDTRRLEIENNRICNFAYGLDNGFLSEVPLEEITLTCNPYYRYGSGKSDEELESLQRADTMKEFISYAVGCMFGRYSLDKPGLVVANQGESLQHYLSQVPEPCFVPDEDNVIPVIGGDWFQDDITERFKKFLKVTFSEEHYSENMQFIEEAIGRDIESYFLKDFYEYHIKMYKKRPIYWMFSSQKGTFKALIYMHRYNKDTVSILLNYYLRQFRVKLEARKGYVEKFSINASISQRERTAAVKELETLKKQLDEITTYENKVIFPLATQQIEIDLDDGVKANYPKFGEALVLIKGLADKTE